MTSFKLDAKSRFTGGKKMIIASLVFVNSAKFQLQRFKGNGEIEIFAKLR